MTFHRLPAAEALERAMSIGRQGVRPLARRLPSWVTPNHLTILRLLLTGVLAVLLWQERFLFALIVYLIAVLTDAVDGELARRRGQTTSFGARLDPTVDKLLHAVVFLFFWHSAPLLLTLLIALDVAIALMGLAALVRARAPERLLGVSVFGRWKMAFQALGVLLLFAQVIVPLSPIALAGKVILIIALLFAFLSAGEYLRRLRSV